MSRSEITVGVNIIRNAILDELIGKIADIDISDDAKDVVAAMLAEEKTADKRKKKRVVNLDAPKRTIPEENQCTRLMKNGEKCRAIKTNDITGSCWGHMTAAEREEHKTNKEHAKIAIGKKKYTAQRKAEDDVDE
jgi:hypothetical protein